MPTKTDAYTIYDRGSIVRIRPPEQPASGPAALLIHGWTGDENVMWVFARALPQTNWIFAPRGPVSSPGGGYGWISQRQTTLSHYQQFKSAAANLMTQVDHWLKTNHVMVNELDIIGFSQGAAVAFTILVDYPERVNRLAVLAGFLPEGAAMQFDPRMLAGKRIFIAHGSQDKTIPMELARDAARTLETAHAKVTYCEDNVGHKLGAGCMKKLEDFFAENL